MQIVVAADSNGPLPEWIIVELQGEVECKNAAGDFQGKFVGDLHYTTDGTPLLIIGHHMLQGKVVLLDRPLVLLVKKSDSDVANLNVSAVVKKKLIFKSRPKPIVPQAKPILID